MDFLRFRQEICGHAGSVYRCVSLGWSNLLIQHEFPQSRNMPKGSGFRWTERNEAGFCF